MSAGHDSFLGPDGIADLEGRPIDEVREQRDRCREIETGLSYLRRLVQGSVDIANREMGRRAGGRDPVEMSDLVDELPGILGEVPRPSGVGRLVQDIQPTEFDDELMAEYEELIGGARIARASDLSAIDLAGLVDQLRSIEDRVSLKRKAYQERIDVLQGELARRYQTGEATVDQLLTESQ